MRRGIRSSLGFVASLALVAGTVAVIGSSSAGATTVDTEAALRTAFADAAETSIVLTADITLTDCGTGSVARSSATPITLDGQGQFTITQTCSDIPILTLSGSGGITAQGVTLAGGDVAIETDGPTVVTGAHLTGQTSPAGNAGGIVASGAALTVTDSVIDHITGLSGALGVVGAAVTLSRVRIDDLTTSSSGGSIGVYGFSATISDSSITRLASEASMGVVAPAGSVTVTRTTIAGISGTTGLTVGMIAGPALSLTDSSITDISGPGVVGTYTVEPAVVTITRSTIARLSATEVGIGVNANVPDSVVTVVNSTIASVSGPAISSGGDVTVVYSTISGSGSNTLLAGSLSLDLPGGRTFVLDVPPYQAQLLVGDALVMFGSVVVQNAVGGPNCEAGSTASVGYNFADDTSCGLTGTGDRQGPGLDALLGPLADNGGPGPTRLPGAGSPLLDAIPTTACQTGPAAGITTDERGLPRPAFDGCDIGAVEVQPAPEPTFTG